MEANGLARVEGQAMVQASAMPADRNPVTVYLARLGSPRSRRVQADALARIAALVAGPGISPASLDWSAIRYQHAQAIRSRLAEHYAPASVNRMLAALKGVVKEAWRLGLVSADDCQRTCDLAPVRGETLPAGRALTAGELRALFAACKGALGARDAALLSACYGGGLRRSEAVALDVADFDAESGALTVRHGKGNKARTTYATNGGLLALEAWMAVRGPEAGPLFVAVGKGGRVTGRRLTDAAVLKALAALARRAGVAAFSPHDLRRSFVGDLLDAGVDISTVARLAGHASVTTTARYDRRPDAAKRRAAGMLHVPYAGTAA